ncbi:thermonuclease family protein [Rhizobium grahamii]|uniref:Putative nuclease protein n=1 Tax=Rhizobium grahamii CCGE 502 TaxID=990285 RepID=S3I275_9HYPH|nr:thermonuclease family protein [Rhizobium grahamii]EPE93888.1 putative nuclease protein [Rhizobium grahamii CCGE 502]
MNCVVDGNTFWFGGEKIRIADIDTPELSPPRCEAERIKGEAAKARLLTLLNAGRFSMSSGLRDENKYGRKLRNVTREGRSLRDRLIDEGLARRKTFIVRVRSCERIVTRMGRRPFLGTVSIANRTVRRRRLAQRLSALHVRSTEARRWIVTSARS